jgi:hypothetical protein
MKEKYINIYWDCAGLFSKSKAFAYFYESKKLFLTFETKTITKQSCIGKVFGNIFRHIHT